MPRLSGWVLDTTANDVLDRCKAWNDAGLLSQVTLVCDAWAHADATIAAFPAWRAALPGVKLHSSLWCTGDMYDNVRRLFSIRGKLDALGQRVDGWTLNAEDPVEGASMAKLMAATLPEPVWASFNGLAEQKGYDFRRYGNRGARVYGQTYGSGSDSNNGPLPEQVVTSLYKPSECWATGDGKSSAWWYRIIIGSVVKWVRVVGYNPTVNKLELRTAADVLYWADGYFDVGKGALVFKGSRAVYDAHLTLVGKVLGFAAKPKVGYTLSCARPLEPQKAAEMVRRATFPDGQPCRLIDMYQLETCPDELIRAVAGAM